jgi:ATP-dependent Clp protease ATP-binding subunit ClpA
MFERLTQPARDVIVVGQREARNMGHRTMGTEHLLLGMLAGRGDIAATVLREAGVRAPRVREDIDRLTGSALRPLGPGDAEALEAIGIDLDAVRAKIEEAFGPGALEEPPPARRRRWPFRVPQTVSDSRHIALRPRARKVLELSLREALRLHHRYIGPEHLLLGLLREGEGLAARILADAGLTTPGLRARVHSALDEAA